MSDINSLTRHHRKARTNGGTEKDINISMVPGNKHESWHILFGHAEVPEIVAILNEYFLDDYVVDSVYLLGKYPPRNYDSSRIRYFSHRKSKREKRMNMLLNSWNVLFSEKNELEIIEEMNQVWINPEYAIRVICKKK